MKKPLILAAAAACAMSMGAATLCVGSPVEAASADACHPVLSADGQSLLYTSADYTGLWLLDLSTGETTQISDYSGAGFAPRFDGDGEVVLFRNEEKVDKLRARDVMSYDIASGQARQLAPMSRQSVNLADFAQDERVTARSDYREIVVTSAGAETRISPVDNVYSYLWVSVSPNQQKLLFVEAHSGMCVCNLDGSALQRLGQGSYPTWLSDEWALFTRSSHDGHTITSSQIMAVEIATGLTVEITPADSMAEDASGSLEAGKIAYSTPDGSLWVVEISLK